MSMDARMEFAGFIQLAPGATAALTALSKAVGDSGLDKALEVINIRALEVNGCSFACSFI
jgi:hypothetical protein